jgi:pimeloyl-ACP methyl ester carboxylesterase
MSQFDDLRERVFALYAERRFVEMRGLLDGAAERFPSRRSAITYWKACIDSLLGDPTQALQRLRRGAEEGLFWPENALHTDPDLTAVRSLPGFEEMVESVRRSAEGANMNRPERPEILLFAPEAEPVRGLLIALHMYNRTAAESAPYWRSATEIGLVVVVPESTQVSGDGEPAWTNAAMTARDLRLARQEALSRFPQGGLATVIGGASQGGGRAAAIALTGDPFDCRGLVAVVSAYPDLPDVPAAAQAAAGRGLRAYLLTGDQDGTRDQVEHFHADLTAGGVETELDVVPGLGHEFPDDFPERLRRAVTNILDV